MKTDDHAWGELRATVIFEGDAPVESLPMADILAHSRFRDMDISIGGEQTSTGSWRTWHLIEVLAHYHGKGEHGVVPKWTTWIDCRRGESGLVGCGDRWVRYTVDATDVCEVLKLWRPRTGHITPAEWWAETVNRCRTGVMSDATVGALGEAVARLT